MADVSARDGEHAGGRPDSPGTRAGPTSHRTARAARAGGDRGQLFLVAAISLAVLFVALALFLNTAIYTQNLATRTSDANPDDATQFRAEAGAGVGGAIRYANYHDFTDNATLAGSLSNATGDWVSLAGRQAAMDGRVVNGTLVATRNGTRVTQDDATRNFTSSDASGDRHNWTLVGSTRSARNLTMTVDPTSLQSASFGSLLASTAFRVNLSDPGSSDAWNVVVYRTLSPAELHVAVVDPGGTEATCPATPPTSGGPVTVDVSGHTVAGRDCPALDVFGELPERYAVQFNESHNVRGTYALVVRNGGPAFDDSPYATAVSGKSPYAVPAVYGATMNVTYASATTVYRTNVTVAPGESDA